MNNPNEIEKIEHSMREVNILVKLFTKELGKNVKLAIKTKQSGNECQELLDTLRQHYKELRKYIANLNK